MRAAVGDRRGMDAGPLLDPAGELCLPAIRAHIEERTRSAGRPPIRRRGRNARRMRRAQRVATGWSQPLAAVGPGTRRLLESRGFRPDLSIDVSPLASGIRRREDPRSGPECRSSPGNPGLARRYLAQTRTASSCPRINAPRHTTLIGSQWPWRCAV